MKSITANLALSQLKRNRKRTIVTIVGIVLSVAMITAVCGFAVSGTESMRQLVGDDHIAAYRATFVSMAAVLGTIIMLASIVVISNAFRISAAERTRQFGILKSVGATKRQIEKTMLYEAGFLAVVSIPVGLVVGLLVQWLGVSIGDSLLAPMNKLIQNGLSIHMNFVFSWLVLGIAVGVSALTVLLSAWLPSRKAANIPAIEAIRMTREIKLRKSKLKTSRLVRKVFGFEGTLAAKAIKRNRRSYRAMVTALAISVILFLVCGGLNKQLMMTMNLAYDNIDANTITTYTSRVTGSEYEGKTLDSQAMERITAELRQYPDTSVYAVGMEHGYTVRTADTALTDAMREYLEPDTDTVTASLITTDPQHYTALCEAAGVPEGSTILINSTRRASSGRTIELQPLRFENQILRLYKNGVETAVQLDAQLTGIQIPQEVIFESADITVVVPDCQADICLWFGNSLSASGFAAYAQDTMETHFPTAGNGTHFIYDVTDITQITDVTRGLTRLITLFLYGFVGMLSLIGLTSVISAISANVQLRAREFAMLTAVGMTQSGVRRMLALESILSALKALLYGIPLGMIATYLVFLSLTQRDSFQFFVPWGTLIQATLGVFVIAIITTQYAAAKLRSGSLIEVIRSTEGV